MLEFPPLAKPRLLTLNLIPGFSTRSLTTRFHIRSECEAPPLFVANSSPVALFLSLSLSARQQRERGRWVALAKG